MDKKVDIKDLYRERYIKEMEELKKSKIYQDASEIKKTEFELAIRLKYFLQMD